MEIDGSIRAVLHIEPDGNPNARESSKLIFNIRKRNDVLTLLDQYFYQYAFGFGVVGIILILVIIDVIQKQGSKNK